MTLQGNDYFNQTTLADLNNKCKNKNRDLEEVMDAKDAIDDAWATRTLPPLDRNAKPPFRGWKNKPL